MRTDWPRGDLDRFVLARLEQAGLSPAPEADRSTLLRRLRLDLTGLPPTPEELAAFLADPAPDAYERVVDRLLATPQHGERMAQMWLDLARYLDTNGFDLDTDRQMWAWRDWVVRAFAEEWRCRGRRACCSAGTTSAPVTPSNPRFRRSSARCPPMRRRTASASRSGWCTRTTRSSRACT